ncbi:MAG TPA: aspartate aminotransferase family protein [Ramlibacter sp.]|uniref:class-III pyridoxal-phosphate-dependent aminotransferase n=1 Tax=Ramlibacter sp. TaxID=1917967 RepID=UPI002BDB6770|nr:aspartate aminotransferase family protein [Ramlibacter sp.]HVZ46343.1 aspartate aminotransferase family protein [Ramlibacter sp.]
MSPSRRAAELPAGQASWQYERAGPAEREILAQDDRMSVRGASDDVCVLAISRAQGAHIEDESGRRYLDFYGNNCHHIGHRHPRVLAAIADQLGRNAFVPRGLTSSQSVHLAQRLLMLARWPQGKVIAARTGSDATEIALSAAKAATGRYKVLSFLDSYHGRSAGALSIGGRPLDTRGLGPLLPGCIHVPPHYPIVREEYAVGPEETARRSLHAIRVAFAHHADIAALVGETIRNGPHMPPDWYWPEVAELCRRHGALLVLDEVATGLGKTGRMFNFHSFGVEPDIVTVGKALGGAVLPMAAVLLARPLTISPSLNLGYFTHEKNPLCAAAGLATLDVLEDERLAERAKEHEPRIAEQLSRMAAQSAAVGGFECAGMMYSVRFDVDGDDASTARLVQRIYRECVERGLLPMPTRGATLAFSGPLIAQAGEVDEALAILQASVTAAAIN